MPLDEILAAEYSELPPEQVEQILGETLGDVSPEELENFWGNLKSVGGAVSKALPGVASGALTGATTGAALGPWGALGGAVVGGTLGGVAQTGQPARPAPAPPAATPTAPQPAQPTRQTAPQTAPPVPAAGQLLQTVFDPRVLQALMAMALGPAGRQNIPVGGTPVPVGAFTNLLGVLAGQAAAEYNAVAPGNGSPAYLYDYAGEPVGDPAVDEHRARALWDLLRESAAERRRSSAVGPRRQARYQEEWQPEEQFDEEDLDEEEFYDWFELIEVDGGYAG